MSDAHEDHVKIAPGRLEAFSDGVLAIIITITVLELTTPHGTDFHALSAILPLFVAYAISFQMIGTYWNNHHHLLRAASHVSAGIMWANLHLLFWLSLIPFVTGWIGQNPTAHIPTVLYSSVLFLCAIAYSLLQWQVLLHADHKKELMAQLKRQQKGMISLCVYIVAIVAGFFYPLISDICIALVAILWVIPDRRIERYLNMLG